MSCAEALPLLPVVLPQSMLLITRLSSAVTYEPPDTAALLFVVLFTTSQCDSTPPSNIATVA